MLRGGLPDKNVVLMTGEPGSGYDVLAQQMMCQHALHGGKVAYFLSSRSPDMLKEDLATFGWDITPLEEQRTWMFHEIPAADTVQFLTRKLPETVSDGNWVILDSLSYPILTQNYRAAVKIVELLVDSAQKHGGVHFLLLTKTMHDIETEITMQHLVDGVIEFSAQETNVGIDRRIRIKKMRRAIYESRLIPFNITDHGITIETAVRIA